MVERLQQVLKDLFAGDTSTVPEMSDQDFARLLTKISPEDMTGDIDTIRQRLRDIQETTATILEDTESGRSAISEILELLDNATELGSEVVS